MTKANLTIVELAARTGVGESWIKQVRSAKIRKPRADWLRAIARELGLDEAAVLGMTDQLGAVMEKTGDQIPVPEPSAPALLRAIEAQTEALTAQTEAFRVLAASIDRAAEGVTGRVGEFGTTLADLLRLVQRPATEADEQPDADDHPASIRPGQ